MVPGLSRLLIPVAKILLTTTTILAARTLVDLMAADIRAADLTGVSVAYIIETRPHPLAHAQFRRLLQFVYIKY